MTFNPLFMRHVWVLLVASIIMSIHPLKLQATQENDTSKAAHLTVGLKETPPFVIKNDDAYQGVAIELWENIATNMGLTYDFKEYEQIHNLCNAVKNGKVDICISPLTVTSSRMMDFDFTQPFYITNLAITTSTSNRHYWVAFITNFFSMDFLKAVLLLLVVIAVFGFLVWLAERQKNQEMFGRGLKGIGHGIWWSAVTMTTVGYGDKAPKTLMGRIITMVWMFTSIIIISGFTASIASSLTVTQLGSEINGLQDLRRLKVGTIERSSAHSFLSNQGLPVRKYNEKEKGLRDVQKGKLDAFFYDKPIMKYHIYNDVKMSKVLKVLPNTFNTQYYSFAVPEDSPLLKQLNVALMKEIEGARWESLLEKYNL